MKTKIKFYYFRIYYDEHNGIYTAAFCRLFIPFKTITFSFPAHSAEVLEPNKFLKACGLLDTPTIKIRPIQKDVYIHHLECLSAEMDNKTENSEIKNKDYFPPAAASATAAINADESISQKRESRESYKISKTGKPKKVGYVITHQRVKNLLNGSIFMQPSNIVHATVV